VKPQFGILASHQFPPGADAQESLAGMFRLVGTARDLGFESVFAINHFVANLVTAQTISVMGRLIDVSGDMRVGTAILLLPLFHPLHVAEEFATLDQMSKGRIILGVGVGYREEEFDAFGVPMTQRGARLDEGVRLIRALWSGEPVDFEGRFWRIRGHRISMAPYQKGGPKIWIGAGARPAVQRAARLGDAWLTPGNSPKPDYAPRHVKIYDEALVAAGKPTEGIERPLLKEMYVAEDAATARAEMMEYMTREYRAYANYSALSWFESQWEGLMKNSLYVGSPADVAEQIRGHMALGFNHFILRPFWGGLPWAKAERSLRLFMDEVKPRLMEAA
jgi:alkanesulfonate monooxygenase SsuD/methylene tetrahydromethanopterin reductase-like flavin-dependent oxidoreductase (luciferase family)